MAIHLQDFRIARFRTFNELILNDFSDVNLVVGKNNVGKTTLLEALRLYLVEDWLYLGELLSNRDEFFSFGRSAFAYPSSGQSFIDFPSINFEALLNSRSRRDLNSSFELGPMSGRKLTVALVWLRRITNEADASFRYVVEPEEGPIAEPNIVRGFEINLGNRVLIPFHAIQRPSQRQTERLLERKNKSVSFLPSVGLSLQDIGRIWDRVALTEDEDVVIAALRMVMPSLEKLVLVQSPTKHRDRVLMAKVSEFVEPVPFKSLGDGVLHLFGIVLALVDARDGVLLADEVENGLHFGVQADFWSLVMELAKRWNVQVFATTHSWDCVRGLQEAAGRRANADASASLYRIERQGEGFRSLRFSTSELAIAQREDIEVR